MENIITIIEGPTPMFELVNDEWVTALNEGFGLSEVAKTTLRSANAPALVERCYNNWKERNSCYLEFKTEDGLTREVPIVAARSTIVDEGDMLYLWVRFPADEIELAFTYEDDLEEDDDDEEMGDDYYPMN